MANTPLKKCPQCGALAYMNAPTCQNCGRTFQTTNPANANQTQVFMPPPAQPTNWNPLQKSAYHGMKRQINWVAWSIIIGSLIVISPIVFTAFSCAASQVAETNFRANRPTVSEFRSAIRQYGRGEDVIKLLGQPDAIRTYNETGYWTYFLKDGNVHLTVEWGVIRSISTN